LANLTWVIPTGQNSDHAKGNDGGGPSWVASIVNAIGKATSCDSNGYCEDTAIIITWDDWGGWYDHEPPTILNYPQGGYQLGFRVPLICVSAFTPAGYINNDHHDFGGILRFIEGNFAIKKGLLGFSDYRTGRSDPGDLINFFNHPYRSFNPIAAPLNASFFINDTRQPTDPDDQ
jgi:phospholipase C